MSHHTLQLLRHAKSSWERPETDDHERPLNHRGRRAGELLAAHLAGTAPPDLILCSSALRTRQTLDYVLSAFHPPPRSIIDHALYLAPPDTLLKRIAATPEAVCRLMLIGHNPGFNELALALAAAAPHKQRRRLEDGFPTGALAIYRFAGRWSAIAAAEIHLEGLVTPAEIAGTGGDDA